MKRTVFYDMHQKAGGKMVPFTGFEMPVEFTGVKDEHIQVRKKVGVFDVSHMGEIWLRGERAKETVQYLTTNDVRKLVPGKVQYTCMPNGSGGIVDDLLVYMFSNEEFLMVVNAANIVKDWNWISQNNKFGALLENASEEISQLAVQGPESTEVLQKITHIDLQEIPFYHFTIGDFAGKENVILSNTGYTGAGGFELYFKNDDGPDILEAIMQAGEEWNIRPIGLAARDTLRLEMGMCLYGNDIDDSTSPVEAGLGWITKIIEGNDFIDKEKLADQKNQGVKRKLVGFLMKERAIPRKGYIIYSKEGKEIGNVTSGTMSPMLNQGIGMGYVKKEYSSKETDILVGIRNKKIPAQVVKPPFYKSS